MDFVVGFMREALSDRVVMVRKSKPDWQTGLLNGVGGKVDKQVPKIPPKLALASALFLGTSATDTDTRLETPIEAMVREFKEETGIETRAEEWKLVLYMNDPRDFYTGEAGGTVYWFAATRRFLPKLPPRVLDSGEELLTVRIPELASRTDVLASPKWVIPMAFGDPTLDTLGCDELVRVHAQAATKPPAFDTRAYVAEQVSKFRNQRASDGKDKLSRVVNSVLAPDPRFDHLPPAARKVGLNPRPSWVDECLQDHLDAVRRGDLRVLTLDLAPADLKRPTTSRLPPTDWRNTLKDMVTAGKPPKIEPYKDPYGDSGVIPLHGCARKFSYEPGAPLCRCPPHELCRGTGVSPTDLARAQAKRPAAVSSDLIKASMRKTGDPEFAPGDLVLNKLRTEAGVVLAVDGDAAWVKSTAYPAKRVTLYCKDLDHDVAAVEASLPPLPTKIEWTQAREVPLLVPHEPVERPDAPHVRRWGGSDELAAAQAALPHGQSL